MRAVIAVLPGDGIGPEVVAEGVRILRAVAWHFDHVFEMEEGLIGGAAIEATGVPLPNETLALCRRADAVLLGAVGGPRWDDPHASIRPEQGLLALRKALGVFANLRPVRVPPALVRASSLRAELVAGVNLLVVRELTGGIYFGEKRREGTGSSETASDLCCYSAGEIERVVRVAARLARGRRRRLASVDKANVLETSRLWRGTVTRVVHEEFPDLVLTHLLVDACAMQLLREPKNFDVIVTENLFGDILTDEAAMLAGSLGMLPSASLGNGGPALYEPIHGSAPDLSGLGVANPVGTILSVALLLRHSLGLTLEAGAVEQAVNLALREGWATADLASPGREPCTTAVMGREVMAALLDERVPV